MEETSVSNPPLLPEKSKKRYETTYRMFKDWCLTKNNAPVSEALLLAYFQEKDSILRSPSSKWCEYSILKTTIFINENIDISKYLKLRAFLKRQNAGYKPKKSNTFNREMINQFLEQAPDEKYLLMKVAMLMGITGACRNHELCDMKVENVKEAGDVFIVKIPDSNTGIPRMFVLTDHLDKVRKYIEFRSKITVDCSRFFMRYHEGRCYNQPVGINTFLEIPSRIAKYLNLENAEGYTGRAFRKTSAMLSANIGLARWNFPCINENITKVSPIIQNNNTISSEVVNLDAPEELVNVKEEVLSDEMSSVEDNTSEANKISYNINGSEVADLSTTRCKDEIVINGSDFSSSDQNIKITKTENNGNPSFVINVSNCSNCNLTININY
ncbi:uncharacterized protein LOC103313307 [Tribolium castaneum]|uniref:Tyr recombinase domain-containing protein n=1 Tax=Tribolium castaneum TaxID=7070 RepID=A0A139WH53_TRICA|nr:PREDICTED: uncharacterized protein LOC103313307 [Tribolium castaneum]KYB27117.1 hypothetical protein TcasGA2_TC033315 [Tribolium castaneum]|eukprot:XP_008194496.1 PREDICTED: uncharacterized protein LOC103313307 [Tribolium castaneum]